MPISKRPGCKRMAGLMPALALLASALPAAAQDSNKPANAREAAQAQGAAAIERLKTAIAAQQMQAGTATPASPTLPAISDAQRRRTSSALHTHMQSAAMAARARAAAEAGQAGLAAQRDAMMQRLGQALGLEAPDRAALAGGIAPKSPRSVVPIIFASSSMPLAELRAYAAQLEKAGGVIAFRGMPGGLTKVGPMAKLTAEMLRLDPGCEGPACAMRGVQVIVDPLVFRQHGVTRVPAFALIPGDPTTPYCERDEDSPRSPHVVYGDAALSGLLDEYARLGGKEDVRDVQARMARQ